MSRRGHRLWLFIITFGLACSLTVAVTGIISRPKGLLGKLRVHYVIIDLSRGNYSVKPSLAIKDKYESFEEMMTRLKPYVAINGTYYGGSKNLPLGDIVADGRIIYRGCQRQGIGFQRNGKIRFFERKGRSRINWRGCYAGIACGPRLLRAGKVDINASRDGFGPCAESIEAKRCAIGASRDGKLILCVVKEPVKLKILAEVMKELGAADAVNLDGGSMCALYENGKFHAEPVMPINNVIAIYKLK